MVLNLIDPHCSLAGLDEARALAPHDGDAGEAIPSLLQRLRGCSPGNQGYIEGRGLDHNRVSESRLSLGIEQPTAEPGDVGCGIDIGTKDRVKAVLWLGTIEVGKIERARNEIARRPVRGRIGRTGLVEPITAIVEQARIRVERQPP